MKTRNLLLALAAMFVLVSCNTDDRKTVFTYEGEKLAQFIEYYKSESGNWYADYKEDIS